MNKGVVAGVVMVVVAGILMLLPGGQQTAPEPSPTESVESRLLSKSYHVLEQLHRDLMEESARRASEGEFTEWRDARDFEAEAFTAAKATAFASLKSHDEEHIGSEDWTAKKHVEVRRRFGR